VATTPKVSVIRYYLASISGNVIFLIEIFRLAYYVNLPFHIVYTAIVTTYVIGFPLDRHIGYPLL
jgi:hypothetical protein